MKISELARRAGTTTRALRFYESQGLLGQPRRAANGYRQYGEEDYRLVSEILTLQAVGLRLDETRPFVDCLRAGHAAGDSCAGSVEVYLRKLAEVDACIARLTTVRAGLRERLTAAVAREAAAEAGPCIVTSPAVATAMADAAIRES